MKTTSEMVYGPDLATKYLQSFFEVGVPAGFPSPAADYKESKLDLNRHLIKSTIKQKNSILLSTILIWLLIFLNVHFIQASLELGLTILDSFSIMILGTIIYAVPSLPGGIATFHLAIQQFSRFTKTKRSIKSCGSGSQPRLTRSGRYA